MKTTLFFIFISAIFCSSCNKDIDKVNYFTSENDTLIIKTEKIKGVGMFPAGAGEIYFETKCSLSLTSQHVPGVLIMSIRTY